MMTIRGLALLGLAVFSVGCVGRPPHRGIAKTFAGEQLGCPADRISLSVSNSSYTWQRASGCDKKTDIYCAHAIVDGDREFQCRLPPRDEAEGALWSAAEGMGCEDSRAQVEQLDSHMYQASGCGNDGVVYCLEKEGAPWPRCDFTHQDKLGQRTWWLERQKRLK